MTTLGDGEMTTTVDNPFFDGQTTFIEVGEERLAVAVADSGAERSRGLMGVEDLGGVDGMFFVFPSSRRASFHMRNTVIPLDLWLISESGDIIAHFEMAPCESSPCQKYRSGSKVAFALETPLDEYDFAVGDHVSNDYSG